VPAPLRTELVEAAIKRDVHACNQAAFKLFDLTDKERSALGGDGE